MQYPPLTQFGQTNLAKLHLSPYYNWMSRTQQTIQRNKHVIITSKRRFDVIITCLLRYVLAG